MIARLSLSGDSLVNRHFIDNDRSISSQLEYESMMLSLVATPRRYTMLVF